MRRYPLINGPNNENIRFCLRKDLNSSWVWRAILWRMEFEESSISQSFEDQCVCLNSSNCILFCSLCDWNLLLVACLHKELIIHQANIKATQNICGDPQGPQNMYSTPGHHGLIFSSASSTSHGAISYSQAVLVQDCTNSISCP